MRAQLFPPKICPSETNLIKEIMDFSPVCCYQKANEKKTTMVQADLSSGQPSVVNYDSAYFENVVRFGKSMKCLTCPPLFTRHCDGSDEAFLGIQNILIHEGPQVRDDTGQNQPIVFFVLQKVHIVDYFQETFNCFLII